MSWTFVSRKGGKNTTHRVSVLDVFRSTSSLKKKWEMEKLWSAEMTEKGADKSQTENAKKATATNPHSTAEIETFTAEEDAKILAMKKTEKTWSQILEALGKTSKSQVQARFKELTSKSEGDNEKGKQKQDEKKMTDSRTKAPDKKASKANATDKNDIVKKNDHSSEDLTGRNVKALAAKYEKNKWLAVASKHFDQTGQRITPEMAKELFDHKV